ncbi:hypothetical protein T492DRAFT_1106621 [Pavlovales sp. CCMP2436]|nr:hypothetical protein T492DRAFT_1106621 [Pavlovales sp. CCMP2436]
MAGLGVARVLATTREWLAKVAPQTQPTLVAGKWRAPVIGAIGRSQILKQAMALKIIELEPTEPFLPRFKGHKHMRDAPMRAASIEEKMKEMPERIVAMKLAKKTLRRERMEKKRQKQGQAPYHYPQ